MEAANSSAGQNIADEEGHLDNDAAASQLLVNAIDCAEREEPQRRKKRKKERRSREQRREKKNETGYAGFRTALEVYTENINGDPTKKYFSPSLAEPCFDNDRTSHRHGNQLATPESCDQDQKTSKKRKRKERQHYRGSEDTASAQQSHKPASRNDSAQKLSEISDCRSEGLSSSLTPKSSSTPVEELPTCGVFKQQEIDLLAAEIKRYRLQAGISQSEMNEKIQNENGNKNRSDSFWGDIATVLPNRSRQSVIKFIRRRWHNYPSRGSWSASEDKLLRDAYELKPNKWKDIGALIGRMPEDCRDRWRNYVKYGDRLRKDIWTELEEQNLIVAVHQCVRKIKKLQRKEAKEHSRQGKPLQPQPAPETLLNWAVVSDRMGGQRSRLQCSVKWKSISSRIEKEQQAMDDNATDRLPYSPILQEKGMRTQWRLKAGEKNYRKMRPGDKYKLICNIEESETVNEERIPWSLIKTKHPSSSWSTMDRKIAFKRMKKSVPEQRSLHDWIVTLKRHIERTFPNELEVYYEWPAKKETSVYDMNDAKPKKPKYVKHDSHQESPHDGN